MTFDVLVARAAALARVGSRRLLGITGAPGAGKSTLAHRLVEAVGAAAVLVPMDGFHLANAELDRLKRRNRKGAPDTFDVAGYVALLQRLRAPAAGETVYAPLFRRDLEEAIAGSVPVPPEVGLVVTEGNYLLLDAGPWMKVRGLLDEAWYVECDERLRLSRLVERHERFGKPAEQARAWALGTDQRNAELIERTRDHADLVVRLADVP